MRPFHHDRSCDKVDTPVAVRGHVHADHGSKRQLHRSQQHQALQDEKEKQDEQKEVEKEDREEKGRWRERRRSKGKDNTRKKRATRKKRKSGLMEARSRDRKKGKRGT